MKVLFHEFGTELRMEDDDRLILNVLCGRVFMYGVEFQLNESEIDQYKREDESFIKKLAKDVYLNPKTYGARGKYV